MAATATFLCVDDEQPVLLMEKMLLESAGFRVLTASSGPEAIATFRTENVDVVVMDYWMPNMNGLTTARVMKHIKPAIPIVFLSAYTEFPGESIGIGDSWIKKGEEDPESLLARFRELLSARPLPTQPLH